MGKPSRIPRKSPMEWVRDQENWIAEHGGDEAGYVARYGSKNDPGHYGDGGEAIYAADFNALQEFRRQAGL